MAYRSGAAYHRVLLISVGWESASVALIHPPPKSHDFRTLAAEKMPTSGLIKILAARCTKPISFEDIIREGRCEWSYYSVYTDIISCCFRTASRNIWQNLSYTASCSICSGDDGDPLHIDQAKWWNFSASGVLDAVLDPITLKARHPPGWVILLLPCTTNEQMLLNGCQSAVISEQISK